jgi:hypothetical protein
MSGEVVGWALRQRTGSPAAKLVLVKLADNANESGFCWPSIGLIVDHTELGQSTVYKHLDHLEAIRLVQPCQHLVGHNHAGNAIYVKAYQLAVPSPETIPPGGKRSLRGGTASARDGSILPPAGKHKEEPSKEPSFNLPPSVALPVTGRAERLSHEIGQAQFNTWFGDAEFTEGSPCRVLVPSTFKRNWIVNKFATKLSRLFGEDVHVEICAPPPKSLVVEGR